MMACRTKRQKRIEKNPTPKAVRLRRAPRYNVPDNSSKNALHTLERQLLLKESDCPSGSGKMNARTEEPTASDL